MNQAVDLATEVSEPGALARSLTALGSIESIRGNFERGLEVKLEALRIAERGGNLTEIARACISAGVSLHELRRYEESLKYYDRALQIGRLVGNIRLQGYALMDRAAAMMDIGLYEDAGPVIEEAKRLIQVLEEKDSLFMIDISDGQREMGLGRWTRATRLWDRGLSGLKELGSVSDYARALTYVGNAPQFLEPAEPAVPETGRAGPSAQSHLSLSIRDVDHKKRVFFLKHLDEAHGLFDHRSGILVQSDVHHGGRSIHERVALEPEV